MTYRAEDEKQLLTEFLSWLLSSGGTAAEVVAMPLISAKDPLGATVVEQFLAQRTEAREWAHGK